jgi:2-dehydro-3-deoxyphosphogluconate aldolase / (4S)-4-hydroxy-2-oxoglutarate aldolase
VTLSKHDIIHEMGNTGIIPVFNHHDIGIAKSVIEVSYKAGIRVFEFTNRDESAFDVFVQLSDYVKSFPDFILGAGTIITTTDCEKFIAAGAKFIVSPVLNTELAPICKKNNVPWIPGTMTLTEIIHAKEAGAEVIKIFPASVVGPKFVSSILPVVPDLKLMPTGGVEPTEENLKAWFDAGVYCAGIGSQLFSKKIIESHDWKKLEIEIASTLRIVKALKK